MSDTLLSKEMTRPLGRPRVMAEADRRQHIVDAAASVFSRKGYWATTMDEVSREAGMSKKTIYQLFSGKAEIFAVLLRSVAEPFTKPFETAGRTQRMILTEGLTRMAKSALDEKQLEIVRVMIAEATRAGDVAAALARQDLCQDDWALKEWLATQATLGRCPITDAKQMASTLFWSVIGHFMITMLLHVHPRPSDNDIVEQVERVVDFFYAEGTR